MYKETETDGFDQTFNAFSMKYKPSMASRFTIYSVNQISDLIYQISYIIYKMSDIYQISNINKISYMSIKIYYVLYKTSGMLYKIS